jgi:hypothetical protein
MVSRAGQRDAGARGMVLTPRGTRAVAHGAHDGRGHHRSRTQRHAQDTQTTAMRDAAHHEMGRKPCPFESPGDGGWTREGHEGGRKRGRARDVSCVSKHRGFASLARPSTVPFCVPHHERARRVRVPRACLAARRRRRRRGRPALDGKDLSRCACLEGNAARKIN